MTDNIQQELNANCQLILTEKKRFCKIYIMSEARVWFADIDIYNFNHCQSNNKFLPMASFVFKAIFLLKRIRCTTSKNKCSFRIIDWMVWYKSVTRKLTFTFIILVEIYYESVLLQRQYQHHWQLSPFWKNFTDT